MATSTVNDRKFPSAGTKVDKGEDAPVKNESAGTVLPQSLAAESYRKDGEFADNTHGEPGKFPPSEQQSGNKVPSTDNSNSQNTSTSASQSSAKQTSSSGDQSARSQAGTAPSYVKDNYLVDPKGPHGQNISKGDFDDSRLEDGVNKALRAEPGSMDDPSRQAEREMQPAVSVPATHAGKNESKLDNKTAFDALDPNTSS